MRLKKKAFPNILIAQTIKNIVYVQFIFIDLSLVGHHITRGHHLKVCSLRLCHMCAIWIFRQVKKRLFWLKRSHNMLNYHKRRFTVGITQYSCIIATTYKHSGYICHACWQRQLRCVIKRAFVMAYTDSSGDHHSLFIMLSLSLPIHQS